MIKTANLTKVFRTEEVETTALNEVNLKISEREFLAIKTIAKSIKIRLFLLP